MKKYWIKERVKTHCLDHKCYKYIELTFYPSANKIMI
jgi:hypothetical protein